MKKINVLELFKGTGSICKALKTIEKDNDNLEINVISLDIEEKYNPTHICNILDFDYKQYDKDYFNIIWGSPPCDKFSKLRNCWIGRTFKNGVLCTKELLEEEIKTIGLPPLYKLQEIINYFKPKYYFIENPFTSLMKGYIDNKDFLYDINKYVVSYCKYSSENDIFDYKKDTSIWTNLKEFNPQRCKNDCNYIITIDTNGSLHYGYNIPIKSKTRTMHSNPIGDSRKTKLIKEQKLHYTNLATRDYIKLDNKIIPLNTKEKREKYKDYKILTKLDLINNNNNNYSKINNNKESRYRIPQKLLIEMFNLALKDIS